MAKSEGITPKTQISETVADVDFVVTALPRTQDVEKVLNMDGGVFKSASKGTVICDTSTISPIASKEFHAEAKKYDLLFCDTPMSGGIMGAQNATLTFMVGAANEDEFQKCLPVLDGMGKKSFNCGGPGNGEIAKICNNLILGIQMVAVSEGFALGTKMGIDPKILQQIFTVSTSKCWCTDATNPVPGVIETAPSSKGYQGGFGTGLIRKDLTLGLECGDTVGVETEFAKNAMEYFLALEKAGHGGKDFGVVYQYILKNKEANKI